MDLLKRLGMIVAAFTVFLVIRTLVAPPKVIVARTADDLKAFLCQTDWWDHSFTILEVLFLIWGIRLCIVVRKAPSEFNESRFISMAIYNEFLLSLFLNISMLFLQSPANPDLLYIIFFCHTQMTVTLLLCFIFGSKAYLVFKGLGKSEDAIGTAPKINITTKFHSQTRSGNSQYAVSTNSSSAGTDVKLTDADIQEEFKRLYVQLEQLKEKNMRHGNRHLAARINAMQEAGRLQTTYENDETTLTKSEDIPISKIDTTAKTESKNDTSTTNAKEDQIDTSCKSSTKFGKPPEVSSDRSVRSDAAPAAEVKGAHLLWNEDGGGNKLNPSTNALKIPIHMNIDDSKRCTEEVTV